MRNKHVGCNLLKTEKVGEKNLKVARVLFFLVDMASIRTSSVEKNRGISERKCSHM